MNVSSVPLTVTQLNNQVKASLSSQYKNLNVIVKIHSLYSKLKKVEI